MKKTLYILLLLPFIILAKTDNRIVLNARDLKEVLQVLKQNELVHSSFYTYNAQKIELNTTLLIKKIVTARPPLR